MIFAVDAESLQLHPNAAELHYGLGLALVSTSRPRDAILRFEAALKLRPAFDTAQQSLISTQRSLRSSN